ncbi:hypothetical protein DVR12_03800 [Chitinophaga silvatica]|uniref:Uncharacterized protein n=1 Tax=Chitinophaga silvatica TaxID=2282649 RepID=A0A3E1YI54_9BACT|nr:hypothetical protein [Chitinophaga silvatica]RFS26920.1 hypothetical protein DVR12_03800 [Chitinophaga silvatica]
MRKELDEIQEIEAYLHHNIRGVSLLMFRARLATSAVLREKVEQQRRIHRIINWAGRETRRNQLNEIHHKLMREPSFYHSITSIFK